MFFRGDPVFPNRSEGLGIFCLAVRADANRHGASASSNAPQKTKSRHKEKREAMMRSRHRPINEQEITNSKDIRKLRPILKDPVAKENFISEGGTLETAMRTLGPAPSKKAHGLLGDIEQISESLQRYSWTTLAALKGAVQIMVFGLADCRIRILALRTE